MSSSVNPTVEIELDRPRMLKMDLNALATLEEHTGKNVFAVDFGFDNLSAIDLRVLLWVCLRHEDPDLTKEHVGEMVHPANFLLVSKKLAELWQKSMPDDDPGAIVKNGKRPAVRAIRG